MTDFEQFWQVYPKKLSKIDALKAWGQMKKRYKFDTDKAIAVVEAQKKSKAWLKDGGEFIPYAGTWLRAGGWENEVESKKETRVCANCESKDVVAGDGRRWWCKNSECRRIVRGY